MNAEREWVILRDQLLSARHAVEAALGVVDAVLEAEPTEPTKHADGSCAHAPEKRRNAATMEHPNAFFCLSCDQLIEGG